MKGYILAIDLGTTLVKFVLFSQSLDLAAEHSKDYKLEIDQDFIEFDPESYWKVINDGIKELILKSKIDASKISSIALSSQAETLILLDRENKPLRKAISWLDDRSKEEAEIIRGEFDVDQAYRITGQPDVITTWPITKILWIKRNQKDIFDKTRRFLLLKDFIIYRLTGNFVSEYSIYNFSYYFNIITKKYWKPMLDYAGIDEQQLPKLIEPGKGAGFLKSELADELNLTKNIPVNAGALDQMAGMIGVGNIKKGIVSETTGTVLAICTLVDEPVFTGAKIPCHYSGIKDKYVLLPVCESGGISLEWFKKNFYKGKDYEYINRQAKKIPPGSNGLIFLPYLTGVNAPEYNADAKGVFYGIKLKHNENHFVRSIMEGVAYLLKKNLDFIESSLNISINDIFSLGGGAKSPVWNQIKSDVLNRKIRVTSNRQPTALGAAMLSALDLGMYKDLASMPDSTRNIEKVYSPDPHDDYRMQYQIFLDLYRSLEPFFAG